MIAPTLLTLGLSIGALADQNPNADVQVQIGAQLGITHDSIAQLLNKMEQQSQTDDGMEHADYKKKSIQTRAKVQTALDAFEGYLRTELFPEVKSDLAGYNEIYQSQAYGVTEKADLLENKEKQLRTLFSDASMRYTAAVYKTMAALGPDANEFLQIFDRTLNQVGQYSSCQNGTNQFCAEFSHALWNPNQYGINLFNYYDEGKDWYQKQVLPGLLKQCFSRSCISMSASDEIILFTVALDSFGKSIFFKTLDGKSFELRSFSNYDLNRQVVLPTNSSASFLSSGSSEYVILLSRMDSYPDYVHALPFDISSTQLESAQNTFEQTQLNQLIKQRETKFTALRGTLTSASDWNEHSLDPVDAICSVGKGTEFACKQGLGCPTTNEYQDLLNIVQNNSDFRKHNKSGWKNAVSVLQDLSQGINNTYTCSK